MICQSCGQDRNKIEAKPSRAMPGMNVLVCGTCRRSGFEPRYILVLAARSNHDVREWIVNHKYHGRPLSAEEITV